MHIQVITLCLLIHCIGHAAAFSTEDEIRRLEQRTSKGITKRKPAAMIAQELERLADLYEGQGNILGQLETLRKIVHLKGLSKDLQTTNEQKMNPVFSDYERTLKAQAGQVTDMKQHFEAQLALGKLYLMRNQPGDQKLAETLLKLVISQDSFHEVKYAAALVLGDLKILQQNLENAAIYYGLVPQDDPSWQLAQAKLGILLMLQKKDGAAKALVNGITALNDSSFSAEDRARGKFIAAKRFLELSKWHEAGKYFMESADESPNAQLEWQANFQAALTFKSHRPELAPIYFERAYTIIPSIQEFTKEQKSFSRMITAKELADAYLERKDLLGSQIIHYLDVTLNEVQSLIAGCITKGKDIKENCKDFWDSIKTVLTGRGPLGLPSVFSKALEKMGGNLQLAKIHERYTKLVQEFNEKFD